MGYHIVSDYSDAEKSLRRIENNSPGAYGAATLEAALNALFAETQAVVHVITGSLRGSGKTSTDMKEHVWAGEISYGGASPGFPHDPVRYASLEQARGRSHDFMAVIDEGQGDHVIGETVRGILEVASG